MERPFVDLHIHSLYSDGSMTPNEIITAAIENNVGMLAVADHDVIGGTLAIREKCEQSGIKYLPAVEIDTLDNRTNFHILAYDFDVTNQEFTDFLSHTRFMLDESNIKLIEAMRHDYPSLSLQDFDDFTYDIHLGGWKALQYFVAKGLTSALMEGTKFYSEYGITSEKSGYSTIHAAVHRIKKAGGYAVLAHPGEIIDTTDINFFTSELRRITELGIEGIECYYPSHSEVVTNACLKVCGEKNLFITAGSDCHGVFGGRHGARVGEMDITADKIRLWR